MSTERIYNAFAMTKILQGPYHNTSKYTKDTIFSKKWLSLEPKLYEYI